MFCKIVVLLAFNFIKKETLAEVFSCEFCKTVTNNTFTDTPPSDYFFLESFEVKGVGFQLFLCHFTMSRKCYESLQIFTCSKSTVETLEKSVNYVKS